MLGDAISHAVLPGIAASFVLTSSRAPAPMLTGALIAGVGAASLSTAITRRKLASGDSALGMVFTSFFALGVVIISWKARAVDLDLGCVLYGLAEFIPLDIQKIGSFEVPRAAIILTSILVLNASLLVAFKKELVLSSFDPILAHTAGLPVKWIHYGLMGITAATAVAAFESVGSVLVVAMFIIPAAAGYLLSDRILPIVLISSCIAAVSASIGYLGALSFNTSVAGMMSVVAGLIYALCALASPRHGVIAKTYRATLVKLRIVRDDLLGMLFRWHEVADGVNASKPLSVADAFRALGYSPVTLIALLSLKRRGYIRRQQGSLLTLTEIGLIEGKALIRSHRLWEAYLAKHLSLPLDHLHAPSERMEHYIGRALARDLESEVGEKVDPHGREIPPS